MTKLTKFFILIVISLIFTACQSSEAVESEKPAEVIEGGRAEYIIVVDKETGCEYIESSVRMNSGAGLSITPRLDGNGKIICKN